VNQGTAVFFPARRWLFFIPVFFLGWVVFMGLMSAQHVLSGAFVWTDALRMTLNQWLPWMLFSPFIFWLAFRFPIERTDWKFRLVIQAGACMLVVFICAVAGDYLMPMRARPLPNGIWPNDAIMRGPPPLWFRIQFNMPVYLVIASLGHAFVYFRRAQQRDRQALDLEKHLAQARLQALRTQLHPHFLFNTLNAISTLIHTAPPLADDMIGNLSTLLRLSLDSATEQEVPLGRELDFLDHYLDIEKIRFGDRLRIEKNISPETRAALVPTFILQPLVENAVRHGVEPQVSPGVVKIESRRDGEMLRVTISDTGVGLPELASAEVPLTGGIGLSNTRARLQSLYPARHRFILRNADAGGCVAELEIPFHTRACIDNFRKS
jgi:signal transduction histidine kinase